jgi:type I restriction enzyme S subunit
MTTPMVPLKFVSAINKQVLPESTDPGWAFAYVDISQVNSDGDVNIPDEVVPFADAPSRARRLAPPGATVISTVRTYLRAIGRVPEARDPLVFSTGFATVEAFDGVDPNFIYFACRSDQFVSEVVKRSTGVSYPAINPSELGAIRVPLPSLEEQRRTARFLETVVARIDAVVANRQAQIQCLTEARDSVAYDAVVGADRIGARRVASLPWVNDLPADWGEPRICQVAKMGTGHTPSRSKPEYWLDCTIPWLTTGDVHRFRYDQTDRIDDAVLHISQLGLDNSAAVLHPSGTVALSRTASAGFSVIMDADMATSQDYATWTPGPRITSDYLLWCLRAMRSDLMGRLAIGSTHKTIYFPDLMSIRVPLPPIQDQRGATESIRSAAEWVAAGQATLMASIERLQEYKSAVITAAVSGAFDVSAASGRVE